ncbi:MAG TPA: GDP-mannose 4,6-dehydratase [Candidatus Paceibacterota bacterium]
MAATPPPRILITGGLGFIFSHVTEYFVQKGWEVIVIDNESAGSHPEIVDGSFEYHKMSVCDREVIELIRSKSPDYVIHAAAISDVDYSIREPYKTLEENIRANLNVFEACREIAALKKFIYVSTDEVYGECEHRKKEDEIIFPRNPYAASKAVGSLFRLAYDNTYAELKDKTAETRFCNVFGPRQDTRKIMPLIKHALETGESLPLHNRGLGYREYIYVKNIPPALELILEKGNRTYNITTNDGLTVGELISRAEKVTGKQIAVYDERRPGMDMRYQMDASRIREDLGWKPTYSFDEGLKEYLGD